MAEQVRVSDPAADAPGEAIHLPGPSYQPVVLALGLTIAIVGIVLSWLLVALGLAITVVVLYRWIRDTRREMSELPLEH